MQQNGKKRNKTFQKLCPDIDHFWPNVRAGTVIRSMSQSVCCFTNHHTLIIARIDSDISGHFGTTYPRNHGDGGKRNMKTIHS